MRTTGLDPRPETRTVDMHLIVSTVARRSASTVPVLRLLYAHQPDGEAAESMIRLMSFRRRRISGNLQKYSLLAQDFDI